jgi:cobalt-zinc-cadmium efflux system outer membrane protein
MASSSSAAMAVAASFAVSSLSGRLAAQSPGPVPRSMAVSLAEATVRALANNLDLRATRADTGLARAQLIGSRLRPNPALALQYQTTGERTAAGLEGDMTVSLTQDLQLWGVRGSRIRAARFEVERMRYSALDAARRVRRQVAASYRELLFLEQRAALLDSLARVNGRIARAAQLAFQQGLGSELDARLSVAAWQQSLLDRDATLRQYRVTEVEFAKLLGDSLTATYRLTDSLAPGELRFLTVQAASTAPTGAVRFDPDSAGVDSLIRLALAQRPDVRAAAADVEAQRATLAAARAAGRPTVAVGALYSRSRDNFTLGTAQGSNLDRSLGLGLVIGLPFFNRNQGEVARAQFGGAAAELRLASTRQSVERDVRVAVQQVALAASQVETLRRSILPANSAALRIVEAAFGRGQANIFQVLQVQRAYVESTTGLLEATRQYAQALADLEAALGNSLQ